MPSRVEFALLSMRAHAGAVSFFSPPSPPSAAAASASAASRRASLTSGVSSSPTKSPSDVLEQAVAGERPPARRVEHQIEVHLAHAQRRVREVHHPAVRAQRRLLHAPWDDVRHDPPTRHAL